MHPIQLNVSQIDWPSSNHFSSAISSFTIKRANVLLSFGVSRSTFCSSCESRHAYRRWLNSSFNPFWGWDQTYSWVLFSDGHASWLGLWFGASPRRIDSHSLSCVSLLTLQQNHPPDYLIKCVKCRCQIAKR